MGGMPGYIGFVNTEAILRGVDSDIRGIVDLSYYVPGFGAYGVSCGGHFDDSCSVSVADYDADGSLKFTSVRGFKPQPFARLGFAFMPEIDHVAELLKIISDETKKDPDCKLGVNIQKGAPINFPRYEPGADLREYQFGENSNGLYVAKVLLRLGDNKSLDSIPHRIYGGVKLEGNKLAFGLSQKRCEEIQMFWQGLEDTLVDYVTKHRFRDKDLEKREFLPFH